MTLRILSLFAGIGGFDLGFARAGMTTVRFVEIDPFCQKVLRKHWPDVPITGDITTAEFTKGEADVVCGGFPCQGLSIAGKHKGLSDARSALWEEFVRAIRTILPQYVVMENSDKLVSRGLEKILGALAEIRYDAEWGIIRAAALGAEHHRARWWMVAYPATFGQGRGRCLWPAQQEEFERLGSRTLWQRRSQPKPMGISHGIRNWMDRIGPLGNAVVPQIPELLGRAIVADYERIQSGQMSCPKSA